MSLDIWLSYPNGSTKIGTGIYVQEFGQKRELFLEEIREKWPTAIIPEQEQKKNPYEERISNSWSQMAEGAGMYDAIWWPSEKGHIYARDIIAILEKGMADLQTRPSYYLQSNRPRSSEWGNYEGFVAFVGRYLDACKRYPDATIHISL